MCVVLGASKDAKWASILVVRGPHGRKPVEMQTVTSTSSTYDWGTPRVLSGLDSTLLSGEDRSLYNVDVVIRGRPRMLSGPAFLLYGTFTAITVEVPDRHCIL